MIVLATCHTQNYAELSAATWDGNKVKYADKHGYSYVAKTDDWYFEPRLMGWERMQFILDLLNEYSDIEWLWWTGTDSMITNLNTTVEEKIAEAGDHDILVSGDFNEIINNDSMLIRNTERSRAYFQKLMDNMPKFINHRYSEQGFMIDTYAEHQDLIKLMPQRFMNSYEYKCYKVAPWNYQGHQDVAGNDGQWAVGDWLVHWPGTQLHERLQLIKEYSGKIVNN